MKVTHERSKKTVDDNPPESSSRLDLGDTHVHELVLVHRNRDPEGDGREEGDDRCERGVDESDGDHEEVVREVDGVVELRWLGPFADLARGAAEETRAHPDGDEGDDLGEVEEG